MKRLLRGRILSFDRAPESADDIESYLYIEDGALILDGGKIEWVGAFNEARQDPDYADLPLTDHRPHLLIPGLIDTHLHLPQMQVVASWGAQLLDWLNNYTFPEEARFVDEGHCARIAQALFDQLLLNGTTSAVAFGSVHAASADAYFAEAERRNALAIGGKVMMDRNAPDAVLDTPQSGYDDSKTLIERWHRRGRGLYAISPRFAITSTPEQLEAAGALAAEHPDCFIQTHLSENKDEIALAKSLFPDARDYLDIYEQAGLVSDKTLLGHSIHLEPREVASIAERSAKPVFCPTSNLFLGSGLFDKEGLQKHGIRSGIATDIGGGTSYSMLQTLNEAYKVLQLNGQSLTPLEAFYWATLGNAKVLGLAEQIGTLEAGTDADIAVLDSAATPAMSLRMESSQTLSEELFVLQILGDDRAIKEVYVSGAPQRAEISARLKIS